MGQKMEIQFWNVTRLQQFLQPLSIAFILFFPESKLPFSQREYIFLGLPGCNLDNEDSFFGCQKWSSSYSHLCSLEEKFEDKFTSVNLGKASADINVYFQRLLSTWWFWLVYL